jgi:hypothetical protein
MRATFPAGTVSGAPKIRAMQIIDELEGSPRGPYAGAVGYFAADGNMDTCITIRTLAMRGRTVTVQAGAGIVADSDPATEYQETLNKARALAVAVGRQKRVNEAERENEVLPPRTPVLRRKTGMKRIRDCNSGIKWPQDFLFSSVNSVSSVAKLSLRSSRLCV